GVQVQHTRRSAGLFEGRVTRVGGRRASDAGPRTWAQRRGSVVIGPAPSVRRLWLTDPPPYAGKPPCTGGFRRMSRRPAHRAAGDMVSLARAPGGGMERPPVRDHRPATPHAEHGFKRPAAWPGPTARR